MNSLAVKTTGVALLFLISIILGIWLRKSGMPLNTVIFTFHKLIGILSIILAAILFYNFIKIEDFVSVTIILIIATILSALTLLVSGAMLSFGNQINGILLNLHRATTILTVLFSVLSILMVSAKK
jgi:hypothetical protein